MPVSASTKTLFTKSRFLNSGFPLVALGESELYAILKLICVDLAWDITTLGLSEPANHLPSDNYYDIPLEWFKSHQDHPTLAQLLEALDIAVRTDADFGVYYENVCSFHKRRLKYQKILSYQPKPTMDQVGPRGLLEYGICGNELLYNWMLWRKWIYDIDNRAAQETGYMFEPILANSLGGIPFGSTNSPVKRVSADGAVTTKGRQVDCFIGADNTAYEFKMRITIAASGQGRFAEELSFPKECNAAGIIPVLIVLDPTPSARLTELSQAFTDNGGSVYVGNDAWQHLEQKAGPIMANFIDKFIRPPLAAMNGFDISTLSSMELTWEDERIVISSNGRDYVIGRDNNDNQEEVG